MRVFVYLRITVASRSVWTSAPRQTRLIWSVLWGRQGMSRRTGGTNAWNSFSESKKSGSYPPRNSSNDAFAPATMKFPDNSNFWANFLCRLPNKTMAACSAQKNGCLLCVFMNSFSLFGDFICIFSSVLQTECVCRLFFYSVDVQYLLTVAVLRCCSCVDLWYCLW